MDLTEALNALRQPARIEGISDADAIASVQAAPKYNAPAKTLTAIPGLHGRFVVRAADALLNLAYATRAVQLRGDVYGAYVEWAWLRYLGLIDVQDGNLRVSAAGDSVRGNQRRVVSEELGIGFAVTVADRWMQNLYGRGAVSFLDVDVVPNGANIPLGGGRHTVTHATGKRPDYFMLHTNPSGRQTAVHVLESKGTVNYGNQPAQLASAVVQLEGVHINGVVPTGIAVSLAAPDRDEMRFIAIDPPGDDGVYDIAREPENIVGGGDGLDDEMQGDRQGDLPPGKDSDPGRGVGEPGQPSSERPPNGLVEATWAQLSDYAGNLEAALTWAPATLAQRLQQRESRDRVRVETDVGTCVGRRGLMAFGDRTVEAFCGIPVDLDDAMNAADPDRVLDQQTAFLDLAEEFESTRAAEPSPAPETSAVLSIRSDGAILRLRVVN